MGLRSELIERGRTGWGHDKTAFGVRIVISPEKKVIVENLPLPAGHFGDRIQKLVGLSRKR